MPEKINVLSKDSCYQGFFNLDRVMLTHELYAGGMSQPISREVLKMRRAVAVLLYDPVLDKLVMIEQFRIGAMDTEQGAWVLELVAGLVEAGEQDSDVAQRESLEESGCEISNLELIREYLVAPAATTERLAVYCARVDASTAEGIHGVAEEGEDILVRVLTVEEAINELEGGKINSSCPIIAMQWFMQNRERIHSEWLAN